jgi:cell division transport system ATP-binding protein
MQTRAGVEAEHDLSIRHAAQFVAVFAGYRRGQQALRGIDFEVRPGTAVAVTGPAGAGTSALVDVLRLALTPFDGAARVLGADAMRLGWTQRARLKRQIGFMAQNPVLLDHMTAFENAALPLRLQGAKPSSYAGDVEELLRFLGLPEADERPAGALSGSERRRVAAARAVVGQPRLLVADEPTAGLSHDLAARVLRLLVSMRRAGAAVVVATQDEAIAGSLAGPHWRMKEGRIALAATGDASA